MREVGIEIAAFLPTKFPIIGGKLNYRNHRKIVVIDGIIGYTGGINIGDEYLGKMISLDIGEILILGLRVFLYTCFK